MFLFPTCFLCNAQTKKYKAIITAMNIDYDGYVYLNLTGENKGLIRIDVIKKLSTDTSFLSKTFGVSDKDNSTFEINASLVSKVIIGMDTFYRYNLSDKNKPDEYKNRKENFYVKKIYGTGDIRLFEWKDSHNKVSYYFKIPQEEELQNINYLYFDTWNGSILIAFRRCEKIKLRFRNEIADATKYPFYNMKTDEEKLAVWKKLIDEYDACELKSK